MTKQTAEKLLAHTEQRAAIGADRHAAIDVQGRYLEVTKELTGEFSYEYGRQPITRALAVVVLENR